MPERTEEEKARVALSVANSWTYDQLVKFAVSKLVEEYAIEEIELMRMDVYAGTPAESVYGRRPAAKE